MAIRLLSLAIVNLSSYPKAHQVEEDQAGLRQSGNLDSLYCGRAAVRCITLDAEAVYVCDQHTTGLRT
jgi:hypothetical protein